MKVAVVETGMVVADNAKVLEERNFPVTELIQFAPEKSIGKKSRFGKKYKVVSMQSAIDKKSRYCLDLLAEKLWAKIC
jgi:aspartate-semialdehyde dehydrogenase